METRFFSSKIQKEDAEETANRKLEINDFPHSLYNYKAKGYTVELVGTELIEGTETFKIKLIKEPKMINNVMEDDITYYFFDKDSFVILAEESIIKTGSNKGIMSRSIYSDYQEVNGLYFPFKKTSGGSSANASGVLIEKVELDIEVDESLFDYREEK